MLWTHSATYGRVQFLGKNGRIQIFILSRRIYLSSNFNIHLNILQHDQLTRYRIFCHTCWYSHSWSQLLQLSYWNAYHLYLSSIVFLVLSKLFCLTYMATMIWLTSLHLFIKLNFLFEYRKIIILYVIISFSDRSVNNFYT